MYEVLTQVEPQQELVLSCYIRNDDCHAALEVSATDACSLIMATNLYSGRSDDLKPVFETVDFNIMGSFGQGH